MRRLCAHPHPHRSCALRGGAIVRSARRGAARCSTLWRSTLWCGAARRNVWRGWHTRTRHALMRPLPIVLSAYAFSPTMARQRAASVIIVPGEIHLAIRTLAITAPGSRSSISLDQILPHRRRRACVWREARGGRCGAAVSHCRRPGGSDRWWLCEGAFACTLARAALGGRGEVLVVVEAAVFGMRVIPTGARAVTIHAGRAVVIHAACANSACSGRWSRGWRRCWRCNQHQSQQGHQSQQQRAIEAAGAYKCEQLRDEAAQREVEGMSQWVVDEGKRCGGGHSRHQWDRRRPRPQRGLDSSRSSSASGRIAQLPLRSVLFGDE